MSLMSLLLLALPYGVQAQKEPDQKKIEKISTEEVVAKHLGVLRRHALQFTVGSGRESLRLDPMPGDVIL